VHSFKVLCAQVLEHSFFKRTGVVFGEYIYQAAVDYEHESVYRHIKLRMVKFKYFYTHIIIMKKDLEWLNKKINFVFQYLMLLIFTNFWISFMLVEEVYKIKNIMFHALVLMLGLAAAIYAICFICKWYKEGQPSDEPKAMTGRRFSKALMLSGKAKPACLSHS